MWKYIAALSSVHYDGTINKVEERGDIRQFQGFPFVTVVKHGLPFGVMVYGYVFRLNFAVYVNQAVPSSHIFTMKCVRTISITWLDQSNEAAEDCVAYIGVRKNCFNRSQGPKGKLENNIKEVWWWGVESMRLMVWSRDPGCRRDGEARHKHNQVRQ
ncbi:hypothetical protein RND81_05G019800 [Saponaria officinalis]|uniref:Uncharacterized protein n=1 Tax=Saponaria officinalis TaxID=3572 RepID=A0AAW1KWS8_SAPOF